MHSLINRVLLVISLGLSVAQVSAAPRLLGAPDPIAVAEECRQVALIIDGISRCQDRAVCTQYLDSGQVYFASKYILAKRIPEANELIERAIIQTSFAIDIGCYGQDNMHTTLTRLQTIRAEILQLLG